MDLAAGPQSMFYAQRGGGAYRNGQRCRGSSPCTAAAATTRDCQDRLHASAGAPTRADSHGTVHGRVAGPPSAGFAYPLVATVNADFAVFWRTLPWDHAAGALLGGARPAAT